jgi:AraC family transcriptional regulator
MTMRSETLARGPGWCVYDLLCTAGPRDRPFEEQHETVCIAAVTHGSFQYRSMEGRALLVPGAVLLGNHGRCFECGHEHGIGDRCISFHFTPDYWEALIGAVPGARTATFPVPRLPPSPSLIPLIATVEAACRDRSGMELEELALRFAGAVIAALSVADGAICRPSRHDERRISDAVRRIEAEHEPLDKPLSLTTLARAVAMSPYHFLRTFPSSWRWGLWYRPDRAGATGLRLTWSILSSNVPLRTLSSPAAIPGGCWPRWLPGPGPVMRL